MRAAYDFSKGVRGKYAARAARGASAAVAGIDVSRLLLLRKSLRDAIAQNARTLADIDRLISAQPAPPRQPRRRKAG